MKGTWREGSPVGDPEGYVEKSLDSNISFQRAPMGSLKEGLPIGDFERWMKGAQGMEHLSIRGGSVERASRGGSFTGDSVRYFKKGSGCGHLYP